MKKRIILLIAVMLMNMFVLPVLAEEEAVLGENNEMLIKALGIDGYEPADDESLTRGEWAKLLSAAVFGEEAENSGGEQLFSDVDETSEFYNVIARLYGIEVVNGYKDGNFGTEDALTVDQAIVTMMRALYRNMDYSGILSQKQGDLLKDTKIADSGKISLNNAYIMICNMMNEEVFMTNSKKSALFMEYKRDLYKVSGVVSDDGVNSKTGESAYRGEEIVIDGKKYTNLSGETGLFGYWVTGYYVDDGEASLMAVTKSKKNREILVYSDNIEEYDTETRTYRYFSDKDSGSLKQAKLRTDIVTVYNGHTLGLNDTSFLPDSYKPKNGFIKLLDNDNDNNYDVVFVYDYKTGVVSATDFANDKIYFKLEKEPLSLKDVDYTIFDVDRNVIATDEITEGTVLSYAVSASGEYIEVVATNNITEDICSGVDYTDKVLETKTGGEYSVSDYFINSGISNTLKSGKKYSFYFDMFNKVVYAKSPDDNTWSIAYLSRVISSDDADGTYVKLMGFGEKMSMIKLAERVTIYKEDNTKAKLPYEKAYTYLDNYISNATGIYNGFSVLIRYKTDVDGNVGTIELPLGTDADLSKADDDRLCVIVNGAETGLKYQSSGHFMGQCAVDSATIGMQLAKDDIENIIKKKADLVNNGTYNLVAYTTRPGSLMAQYMLMTVGNSDVKEFKDTYFVVEDVYSVYDEDYGEVSELKGWYVSYYDRREETIRINDSQLIKNAVDFAGNKYKVSAGDVIYISMNSKKDAANGIYMIYDADGKNGAGTGLMGDEKGILAGAVQSYHTGGNPYGNPYSFNVSTTQVISPVAGDYMNNNRIFLGYVKEANDSAITVTTQQLGKNSEYNMNYDKSKYYTEILPGLNSKIIKLDMTGKKTTVSQGSLSDLKSFDDFSGGCSKVLLLQREWVTIGVIVIEE